MASLGYYFIHFESGELSTFTRLCSLRHFNLYFIGIHKIFCCHAKAARSHLLDGTVGVLVKPGRVLAAFPGIASCPDGIHCNS